MDSQALIQVKVDRPLKDEVSKIFASLGLDVSTAVRMFFQRCRIVKGIPFELTLAGDSPKVKFGACKGKWKFSKDWYEKDRDLDKELESDFYGDPT